MDIFDVLIGTYHIKDGSVDDATVFVTSSLVNAKNDMIHPLLQLCIVQLFGGIDTVSVLTYLTKLQLWNTLDSDASNKRAVVAAKLT